jgi:hypothetical protein
MLSFGYRLPLSEKNNSLAHVELDLRASFLQ